MADLQRIQLVAEMGQFVKAASGCAGHFALSPPVTD